MSYQVLARKWRPGNFDELVGQSHVLRALTSALDNDRLHHAYLFTGTRGVGKTTIARILSRCLNCEQGISSKPCGSCSSCLEISEGRFVDLIEVDAASRTKVEDTRELLENVQYRPTRGRYKVYLIDEVHMLSTHSFNALLKTLEEPPPHVVFLLATTDPQKLPATVLSRCLQFHLKNMQPEDISNHLAYILQQESIESEKEALESISWSANGSMRDALSLLDQAIAFGDGKVLDKEVREMLGTIDRDHVYRLINAIAANDGKLCLSIIDELSQFAPEYDDVLAELLAVLHRIALIQQIPDASIASQDLQKIQLLAENISAEDVQLFYQLALHGRRDLPLAPNKRSGFEMCILRLISFRPTSQSSVMGATPVKKLECSSHQTAVIADVSSTNTKLVAIEEAPPMEVPDYLVQDDETQQYKDVEQYDSVELIAGNEALSSPQKGEQGGYHGSSLVSPLLRNKEQIKPTQTDNQKPSEQAEKSKDVIVQASAAALAEEATIEEAQIVDAAKVDVQIADEQSSKEIKSEVRVQSTVPVIDRPANSSTLDDNQALPTINELCRENWHLLVARSSLTGVTEQIALNSQFTSFDGNEFVLSLANSMRSMVSNEHLNRLTSAINGLYNTDCRVKLGEQEPDYETPRARKERILKERHEAACADLYSDPQIQALLKTFEAQLDQESVVTLLP